MHGVKSPPSIEHSNDDPGSLDANVNGDEPIVVSGADVSPPSSYGLDVIAGRSDVVAARTE